MRGKNQVKEYEQKSHAVIKTIYSSAHSINKIENNSVDLVVTSPPYPMIEMWDVVFSQQDKEIMKSLQGNNPLTAFELMHRLLDKVWKEVYRILKNGGIACINIGDAVRTFDGNFCLFSNHSRILSFLSKLGFTFLPDILWRKETNAPNKFMGSGMLPVSAYVTYEHEYILIVRKGKKREFTALDEKKLRKESAFFWEERNIWFSDLWQDISGASQRHSGNGKTRLRSGAFPLELAYRLILMYSIKFDTVMDPFTGTGTTLEAAALTQRNAIGVEIDKSYQGIISKRIMGAAQKSVKVNQKRIQAHLHFVKKRIESNKALKYTNKLHKFPVVTSQETELCLRNIEKIQKKSANEYEICYSDSSSNIVH